MAHDGITLALIALVFAMAGYIKGVIGLGLPTIATGLMGLFLTPVQAASIVVLPAVLTNVWQMWNGRHLIVLLRRLAPLLIAIVLVTMATAGIMTRGDVKVTVACLGAALIAYAAYALWAPQVRIGPRYERLWGLAAGIATGCISGTTGVFVVPSVPFLQAIGLDKDEMVQAIGITAFTSAAALALGLGVHGGLSGDVAIPVAVALAAGFAGMGLGQILRDRLAFETFRRWVLIGLAGLGATMIARLLS